MTIGVKSNGGGKCERISTAHGIYIDFSMEKWLVCWKSEGKVGSLVSQKLKVLDYARKIGVMVAARAFNIHHSLVSRWKLNLSKLESSPKSSRKIGSGRRPTYSEAESALFSEIIQSRDKYQSISCSEIRSRMRELCRSEFKASTGWLYGFMKRFNLSLRGITTYFSKKALSVNNQNSLHERIRAFHEYFVKS